MVTAHRSRFVLRASSFGFRHCFVILVSSFVICSTMIDYDPHDWDSHLYDIQGSMIREIFGRVATCVVWAALVVVVQKLVVEPHRWTLAFPETGHTLVGVALGLLLVFRTNASYDRFWEGRKLWGSIVNESRNLARSASIYLAAAPDLVRPLLMWTSVYA